ncbi:MAG TPA: hypothetical protein PLY97_10120 [Acidocella sp.]|nr:MAG: hypothetical protein B7Z80_21035 [Rhodospirillales bacterium 20-64-7]HQT47564.1 hypothetical protein [Acidocella sp.]
MVWPIKSNGNLARENAELQRQLEAAKERIRVLLLERFQQNAEIARLRDFMPDESRRATMLDSPNPAAGIVGDPDGATKQFIDDFYKAA